MRQAVLMKPERLMSVPGIGQIIFSAMLAAIVMRGVSVHFIRQNDIGPKAVPAVLTHDWLSRRISNDNR
jgi:hypothetical protein